MPISVPAVRWLSGYGFVPLDDVAGEVLQADHLDLSTVVPISDPRLTDARTPLAHNQAWSTITGTPTTRAGYGITDAEASGAASAAQAFAIQRGNHTGTQAWSTLTGTPTTLAGYGITDSPMAPTVTLVVPTTGQTQTFTTSRAWHIIACNHTATIAAQTFVFPTDANSAVGQELRIFSRSIITTVTLTLNSNTILGTALTTLPASGNVAWRKVGTSTWVRAQ